MAEGFRFFGGGCFGDNSYDRFRVAGPHVHPGLFFAQPESVAFVAFPVGECLLDLRQDVGYLLIAELELFLGHHVGRVFGHELFRATLVVCHPAEYQRCGYQRVTAIMQGGENHASVAFAADNASVLDHLKADVDFSHLGATAFTSVLFGHIFVHAAGGKIHAGGAFLLAEYFFGSNGKSVFFADTLS